MDWTNNRNNKHLEANCQFTSVDAPGSKFKRLYPSL